MMDDPNSVDYDPYVAWARAQQLTLPGELAKPGTIEPRLPPPPPPPPPPQTLGVAGVPVAEEVPQGVVAPEPPPMQVDAVSAADPAPQVADIVDVHQEQPSAPPPDVYASGQVAGQTPDAYLAHMQDVAAGDSLPSSRERTEAEATQRAVNAMTPEQLIEYNTKRESAMLLEQARLQHEAELANAQRAQQALAMQQAATAKADADTRDVLQSAHEMSLRQINPDRYKNTRGIGRTVLDVGSLLLSGLGGNAEGAIRSFDQRVQQDIDAQAADIQNGWKDVGIRQNEIANEYARHGDLYRAAETYRISAYQSQINDIQTQMQMYDPAGSTALRLRQGLDQFHAAQAQATEAFKQQQFKNNLDAMKAEAEYAEKMAAIAKTQAETAKLRGQIGAAKVKVVKFEDVPRTAEELRGLGIAIPNEVKLPAGGLSIAQAQKIAATAKGVEEWQKAVADNNTRKIGGIPTLALDENGKPKVDFNGKPVMKYEDLKNDDGTEFKPPTEPEAIELRKKTSAVNTIQSLMSDTIMLRKKYGWSSDLLKSPEWRKMKANWSTILTKQKDLQALGAISESDLKLIEGLMGTKDPTEYLDPLPGMIQAFDNTELSFNNDLRGMRYTGPDLHRARPWEAPEAEATPEQKTVEAITAFDPKRSITSRDIQDLGIDPRSVEAQGGRINTLIAQKLEQNGGVPPRIKAGIDSLRAMADHDPDPKKRDFAAQSLKNIGNEALDPNVKAYATANAFDPAAVVDPNLTKEEAR